MRRYESSSEEKDSSKPREPNHMNAHQMAHQPLHQSGLFACHGTNWSCSSQMIHSLISIVQKQTFALQNLSRSIEDVITTNIQLKERLRSLEEQKKQCGFHHNCVTIPKQNGNIPVTCSIKIEGQTIDSKGLIDVLFGKKKYDYQLRLTQDITMPLYRERNFSLLMELIDASGKKIENQNKIPMSLAVYTCENPPKFIEKNTGGETILKGFTDQYLLNGVCMFEKVQVREVTSHYRGGWVYFVVMPCMPSLGAAYDSDSVDFSKIQPLVLPEVVVKAKKVKKKATNSEIIE